MPVSDVGGSVGEAQIALSVTPSVAKGAHIGVSVAVDERAEASALTVRPLSVIGVAVRVCETTGAVHEAVEELALVHVAVLEVEAAVAGHVVARPLAGVLEATVAAHDRLLVVHEPHETLPRATEHAAQALVAIVGERTIARALLEAVDEEALELIAALVDDCAEALFVAVALLALVAHLDARAEADGREQHALVDALVAHPVRDELLATLERVRAASVAAAVRELALVLVARAIEVHAEAVYVAVLELAAIDVAVLVDKRTASSHLVHVPLADVLDAAIARQQCVGAHHGALDAAHYVADFFDQVTAAVGEVARAVAMLVAATPVTFIYVTRSIVNGAVAMLASVALLANVALLDARAELLTRRKSAVVTSAQDHVHNNNYCCYEKMFEHVWFCGGVVEIFDVISMKKKMTICFISSRVDEKITCVCVFSSFLEV